MNTLKPVVSIIDPLRSELPAFWRAMGRRAIVLALDGKTRDYVSGRIANFGGNGQWRPNRFGLGAYFNGGGRLYHGDAFDAAGASELTFGCLLIPGGQGKPWCSWDDTGSVQQWLLERQFANQSVMAIRTTSGTLTVTSTATVTNGVPAYFVGRFRQGSHLQFWRDGVFLTENNSSGNLANPIASVAARTKLGAGGSSGTDQGPYTGDVVLAWATTNYLSDQELVEWTSVGADYFAPFRERKRIWTGFEESNGVDERSGSTLATLLAAVSAVTSKVGAGLSALVGLASSAPVGNKLTSGLSIAVPGYAAPTYGAKELSGSTVLGASLVASVAYSRQSANATLAALFTHDYTSGNTVRAGSSLLVAQALLDPSGFKSGDGQTEVGLSALEAAVLATVSGYKVHGGDTTLGAALSGGALGTKLSPGGVLSAIGLASAGSAAKAAGGLTLAGLPYLGTLSGSREVSGSSAALLATIATLLGSSFELRIGSTRALLAAAQFNSGARVSAGATALEAGLSSLLGGSRVSAGASGLRLGVIALPAGAKVASGETAVELWLYVQNEYVAGEIPVPLKLLRPVYFTRALTREVSFLRSILREVEF